MKEKEVKEYLAHNLHVISDELTLIGIEYYLENSIGSDGFIDILAVDQSDNYVIIELKTSKKTSREAIQEVTKYSILLKNKLCLADDEIRIIIISTDWEELYMPFVELRENVGYLVEGYLLTEKLDCEPIEYVITKKRSREFSRNQLIFLYESEEKLSTYGKRLPEKIKNCGIEDFILLKLKAEKSQRIIYPYAYVLIIKRYDEEQYVSILKDKGWDEQELYSYDYEGEELAVFLEECIYMEILDQDIYDDVEISYPEKLAIELKRGWKVEDVIKYGFFQKEQRGNSWFLKKITGIAGENIYEFYDCCDAKFKAKFQKMLENVKTFLGDKDDMYECFSKVWSFIIHKKVKSVIIDIYNRGDILYDLMQYEDRKDVWKLPYLDMYVQFEDLAVERFSILLAYSGKEVEEKNIFLDSLIKSDGTLYFLNHFTGEIKNYNASIMKKLGLTYDWLQYCYKDETWKKERTFLKENFDAFYDAHRGEIKILKNWFLEHVVDG